MMEQQRIDKLNENINEGEKRGYFHCRPTEIDNTVHTGPGNGSRK